MYFNSLNYNPLQSSFHQAQLRREKDIQLLQESWHTPIDTNELARLEQELEEEQQKWTDYNTHSSTGVGTDPKDNDATCQLTRIQDETSTSTTAGGHASSTSSTASVAAAATLTSSPVVEMDMERICACEFRRLLLRLAAHERTSLCLTQEMIQCVSNLIDDVVQYRLTSSSTPTGLLSLGETGVRYTVDPAPLVFKPAPIVFEPPPFKYLEGQIWSIRRVYAACPDDPNNWSRSTHVTKNLVNRWYQRYESISPEPIHTALLTEVERAVLGGVVEEILKAIIKSLGVKSKTTANFSQPRFVELFTAVKSNLSFLTELVQPQLDVNPSRPPQWIALDQYPRRTPVSYIDAHKLDHTESMERMNQLNRTSWYMQPQKLLSYAQQFVRGQMSESNSIKKLREFGIKPLQFYASEASRSTTFELTDATDNTYRLVCESTVPVFGQNSMWSIRSPVDGTRISTSLLGFSPSRFARIGIDEMFRSQFQFILTPSEQQLLDYSQITQQGLSRIKDLIDEEERSLNSSECEQLNPGGFGRKGVSDLFRQFQTNVAQQFKDMQQQIKEKQFEQLFDQIGPLTRLHVNR